MRSLTEWFKDRLTTFALNRIIAKGKKMSEHLRVQALEAENAALRAQISSQPVMSFADQIARLTATPNVFERANAPAPMSAAELQKAASFPTPVAAPQTASTGPDEPLADQPLIEAPPEPLEPSSQAITDVDPSSITHSQEAAMSEPAQETQAPPKPALPSVKMMAPLMKIALATLSIEQMIELGLHVKDGAPGFQQFLESDTAKDIFKDAYRKYCDFLAGKLH